MIKKRQKKTFTLVEMLIVVVIIGILAAALIPRLVGAQERARDTARKGHLNNIITGLTSYYNDIGVYTGVATTTNINDIQGELVPKYLESLPSDPQAQRKLTFLYGTANKDGKPGQYAYSPMMKNGKWQAGVIVGADTEGDMTNANFVYNTTTPADFHALTRCIGVCGATTSKLAAGRVVAGGVVTADTEATDLQVFLCSTGVKLDKTDATPANRFQNCVGQNDPELLYVIVK